LQPLPLALNIERRQPRMKRVGRHSHHVQTTLEHWRIDTLLGRQAAHERIILDDEYLRASSIFPRHGVKLILTSDEQDTPRSVVKCAPGRCLRWEEGTIERLPIRHRIVGRAIRIFWSDCAQI